MAPRVMNAIPYYRFTAFTVTADTDHRKYPRLYVLLRQGVRLTRIQEHINRGSATDRSKKFCSSPKLPDRLWDLPSLVISWHRGVSLGIRRPEREAHHLHLLSSRGVGWGWVLRMSSAIPPLLHVSSWHVPGRPYLHMIHNPCNTRIYTITVPTKARKYIGINLYTQRPPTRFNQSCSHLRGRKIVFTSPSSGT